MSKKTSRQQIQSENHTTYKIRWFQKDKWSYKWTVKQFAVSTGSTTIKKNQVQGKGNNTK